MAMKVDKEFLLKHRFWIGLGAFALLWLIALILLPVTVGSEAGKKRTEFTTAFTQVEKIKNAPNDFGNPQWEAPLKKKEAELSKRKEVVWKESWQTQSTLMDWPGDSSAPLNVELKNAYFLDPIAKADERQRYADTLYEPQFSQFKGMISPAYYKGGTPDAILHPVKNWSSRIPPSDECWFAQEDLWVKRELLHSVREAIDNVARFERDDKYKPDAKEKPLGAEGGQRFRNGNWEVTLFLETDKKKHQIISPKSTIKNINPNYRKLSLTGVFLEVLQRDKNGIPRDKAHLALEGDPVAWGQAVPFNLSKEVRVDTFAPADPMEVHQVFTWFSSPVKRLDLLEVGNRSALSHRFAKWGLVTKSLAAAGDTPAPEPTPTPTPGGGMGSMPGGGIPGGFGNQPGGGDKGKPDVEKNRYLEVSDQVRRMPVALVLVVDQSRIQDVLTALIDSRLHVWITQWEWQHTHGVQPPAKLEVAPEPADRPAGQYPGSFGPPGGGFPGSAMGQRPPGSGSGMPGMPVSGMAGGTMSGMPGGGTPGGTMSGMPGGGTPGGTMSGMPRSGIPGGTMSGAPGGGMPGMPGGFGALPPSDQLAGPQDDANLVQLTVYGIASLYERYPPKPAAGEAGAAPDKAPPAAAKPPAGGAFPGKP